MPYNKSSYYKRKYPYRKKASTGYNYGNALSMALKALMIAKGVKSLLNVELKNQDTSDSTTISALNNTNLLTPIQGTGAENRVGRSVLVKKIHVKGALTLDTTNSLPNRIRVMLVLDHQPNQDQPASGEIVENDGVRGFRELAFGKRFKVYYDKIFSLDPNSDKTEIQFQINRAVKFHSRFEGNGGTYADVTSNSLWLYFFPDSTTAGERVTVSWNSRVRWIDN